MTTFRSILAGLAAGLLALGCAPGKTSDPGAAPPPVTGASGIALPREVSALPTQSAGAPGLRSPARGLARLAQAAAVPAGSDYENAVTRKYVNERSLSQFDILNTIFDAIGQTHYADAENVNHGPYGAMVSWSEENDGTQSKKIVPWVVDSSVVSQGGQDVNVVKVWMQEVMGDGQMHVIKVQLTISEPPTQRADGSYADYGVWRLDAKFDPQATGFFVAEAVRNPGGGSVIRMHQTEGPGMVTRGLLVKGDAAGYGKVEFPDWSACGGPCGPGTGITPPLRTVAYAYDASHAALQSGSDPVVYKDRSSMVDLGNRYGLFDAASGEDVGRSHSFGFPITFTDGQGNRRFGYYGAWQGRHQLWADGQPVPAGTTVIRADRPPGQAAETYTAGDPFVGTLVKRTLVAADIQDVKGLVVETFESRSFTLSYDGAAWAQCVYPPPPPPPNPGDPPPPPPAPPTCTPFTDFASLVVSPGDTRRFVNANRWNQATSQPETYLYQGASAPLGEGFYLATNPSMSSPPALVDPPVKLVPQPADQLWVNMGGSIYISFDGSAWVRKALVSFDQATWTPTFDPAGDVPFTLELGREYYANNPGANYVVKRTGPDTYQAEIEIQSVANPANAASFVPAGTVFKPQWGDPALASSYRFETSPGPTFLKLVYQVVGSEAPAGAQPGDLVTSGQWGLVAWQGGVSTGVQFNWDYPRSGESFGAQQFLMQGTTYLLLDNPIRLQPIALLDHAGRTRTFQLQFDGSWVQGLPDIFDELRKAGFNLTADIADKVVFIPAGTEVVDADQPSQHYLFKPLDVGEFMAVIADPGNLTLGPAPGLDLATVPDFVDAHIGPLPDVPVKYSEGVPVH